MNTIYPFKILTQWPFVFQHWGLNPGPEHAKKVLCHSVAFKIVTYWTGDVVQSSTCLVGMKPLAPFPAPQKERKKKGRKGGRKGGRKEGTILPSIIFYPIYTPKLS
jgi:hypothetical protein